MNKKQAKKLFDRYLKNECTPQEMELLQRYLDSFQDKNKLWSELRYDQEIKERLWSKINAEIFVDKKPNQFSFKKYLKYAAIFIGILGGLVWFQFNTKEQQINNTLVNEDAIVIKTSDNRLTKINTDRSQVVVDGNGGVVGKKKGNQIRYDSNEKIKELVFNEIIIPNGKKFQLILSDGTLVHLNSGSTLKYPVNFISGHERQVFLTGEAYFEVTKNSENSFLVSTNKMDVTVLGTHFNVSSYEGSETFAVLAEGSVSVSNQKSDDRESTIIKPGEMASITTTNIEVKNVDLKDYLSWREGILSFHHEPFSEIINKIERQYGVTIENKYDAMSTVRFRGNFKEETIIDLLDTFKESAEFDYSIDNNKIIITNMN